MELQHVNLIIFKDMKIGTNDSPMLDIGARSVSHMWGSCLDLGSTLVICLVFKNICKAAPKDIWWKQKASDFWICMWGLVVSSEAGEECRRGIEEQRGWFIDLFFRFTFMNTKRRAVSNTHANDQTAAKPASSRLGRPDTKWHLTS